MKSLILALLLAATAFSEPRIFYSKLFPGSKPEWVGVGIAQDGKVEYRETKEEEPVRFQLSKEDCEKLFALAEKLDRFSRKLESGLPVAKMGEKSYRWEDGDKKSEVSFNYSTDLDAQAIQDFMERIVETEQLLINLERTVRFDRLGVNQALLQLQIYWDRKRLVTPAQFLKLLDRVVKNDVYLNMARDRAAQLAAVIRASETAEAK